MTTQVNGKKVLLCGPSRASVSGVATHLNQLFGSVLSDRYELVQFQIGSEGRSEALPQKLSRFLWSPISLLRTILRMKPDIVHLNSSLEPKAYWRDLAYLLVAKASGCKVVYQVHGGALPSSFLGPGALAQSFLRWSLNLPDALVLLAEVERLAYQRFKVGKHVTVIPNAIALDDDVEAKTFHRQTTRLGYIGRLANDKGVLETIQALALLKRSGLDALELQVAGSGPFERELVRAVSELGIGAAVQFAGPLFGEEKRRFWGETDVFVFPTFHREGLPYAVLEALASGTPTITTRVGGIPDVITNGLEGILLDSHDPPSVAHAIRGLIGDRERLREMSRAALNRAREHYGVDRLAMQFDELYLGLLS